MAKQFTQNLLFKIEELQNRLEESEQLIEAIKAGEVDAFAINRQRSLDAQAASASKLRALGDSFLDVDQCFVVAKGDRGKLGPIEAFVADARASGFIKSSIERAGVAGVDVAVDTKSAKDARK